MERFLTGVNYWPRRKAMYWWADFDASEVSDEFDLIALTHNLLKLFRAGAQLAYS